MRTWIRKQNHRKVQLDRKAGKRVPRWPSLKCLPWQRIEREEKFCPVEPAIPPRELNFLDGLWPSFSCTILAIQSVPIEN